MQEMLIKCFAFALITSFQNDFSAPIAKARLPGDGIYFHRQAMSLFLLLPKPQSPTPSNKNAAAAPSAFIPGKHSANQRQVDACESKKRQGAG